MDNTEFMAEDSALVDQFSGMFGDDSTNLVDSDTTDSVKGTEVVTEELESESEVETESEADEEYEIETVDLEGLAEVMIDGEKSHATIKDLVSSYTDENARAERWKVIQAAEAEILEKSRKIIADLELAELETDALINDGEYANLEQLSGDEFKRRSLALQNLNRRKALISERLAANRNAVGQQDTMATQLKIKQAKDRLNREVEGFSVTVYNDALAHAVNVEGVDKDFAINCMEPSVIKSWIMSHRNYVNPAQTKKTSMPKKTVKTTKAPIKTRPEFIDGNRELPSYINDLI